MLMPPMFHWNYTKIDKEDMRKILQRQYAVTHRGYQSTSGGALGGKGGGPQATADPATDIVSRRQESIRKRVVAHNGLWAGVVLSTLFCHMSIRHYDYKTKLILLPFTAYGGSWIGRWVGDGLTGRWSEWGRDRALGQLPARVYFQA
ncbi:integral membrane duf56 family protein [Cystoisospora suis]|uniref:Integral membrane duf56 family protein n=1 Tax=Cystoisospora suis TaxID=483139 RepID=A0A2C6KG94_9APIC|nr:integral membrane duf56 family protein [Cystoisospora suis]